LVKPNTGTIDYSKFGLLLDRLVAVINVYGKKKPKPPKKQADKGPKK